MKSFGERVLLSAFAHVTVFVKYIVAVCIVALAQLLINKIYGTSFDYNVWLGGFIFQFVDIAIDYEKIKLESR